MEIDLSGNKLETLTPLVIEHLTNMRMLKRLVMGRNPWSCDQHFVDFIQSNRVKVDYQRICNGAGFSQGF